MLAACLPVLITLLVCLTSTITAWTPDHQQLDISGTLVTNKVNPVDNGGKYLSKRPTHSAEEATKLNELRNLNYFKPRDFISEMAGSFSKAKLDNHHFNSVMHARIPGLTYIPQMSGKAFPCPNSTAIAPCVCEISEASELILDCSGGESLDQLSEIFRQNFPVKQFDEFWIQDNDNIHYLADIFNGLSFRFIFLNNMSNLTEISNFAFYDSRSTLENMYIDVSNLDESTFPFSNLGQYTELNSLTIATSNLTSWPLFSSSSIKHVNFFGNHITALPAGEKYNSI